jgi:two-component system nitrogen regulation response regulator GlnG
LRERAEDIPALARHFMLSCAGGLNVEPKRLSDEVLKEMSILPFPGNVRQLENLCHWLTVMSPANIIGISDLPSEALAETTLSSSTIDLKIPTLQGSSMRSNRDEWDLTLERLAVKMLQDGEKNVFDTLTLSFEKAVLKAALEVTRGRRVEAAQRLGIGRNTITRKLQELDLND